MYEQQGCLDHINNLSDWPFNFEMFGSSNIQK